MRNLSSTFRHEMYYNSHDYDHKAIITLANNTVLTLTNTELWAGGFSIDDAVSEDNSFTALGSTIIGSAKIIINNIDQSYSDYDFTNAKVELSLSKTYMLNDVSTTESIRIGRYTVDECVYNGGTITLSVLDNMEQFDRPYSLSNLTYPATLVQIVQDACLRCGVLLQTYTFPHYNYSIPNRPVDEAITFRQVLGWVATIAGCFARCNSDGKLELKWFDTSLLASINEGLDGGVFDSATPYASGDTADGGSFDPWNIAYDYDEGEFANRNNLHYLSRLYSQTIGVDDIVITGVHIIIEEADENNNLKNKEYTFGESGYIIKVEGNKLITKDSVSEIGTWLANAIVGMRFRNVNVIHIDDPSIEAGDIALVIDRKQNEYPILVTRTSYSAGSSQTTVCGAESPSRNSANRFSQVTQAYVDARNLLNREQTRREQALRALTMALEAKSGLYSTEEAAPGGGTIYYLHDKPRLEDSMVVWKMTAEAWGVSTDGGEHWNAGMTVNGDVIARILSAIGVNADWIDTGSITVGNNAHTIFRADIDNNTILLDVRDTNNANVKKIYINSSTGQVDLVVNSFRLISGNTTKTISEITEDAIDDRMTQEEIFDVLTNNGVAQGLVLINGRLYINWEYATGGALTLGGLNNTNGYIRVLDGAGNEIGKLDKDGLKICTAQGWASEYIQIKDGIIYGYRGNDIKSFIDFSADFEDDIRMVIDATRCYQTLLKCARINIEGDTTINGDTYITGDTTIREDLILPNLSGGGSTASSTHVLTLDNTDGQTVRHAYIAGSSLRYKQVGKLTTHQNISDAYKVNVYQAQYKQGYLKETDQRNNIEYPMFIAEQMNEHLPIAVDKNENGQCETWNERVLIPIMFQMIKDQKKEIEELKQRLDKLESLN